MFNLIKIVSLAWLAFISMPTQAIVVDFDYVAQDATPPVSYPGLGKQLVTITGSGTFIASDAPVVSLADLTYFHFQQYPTLTFENASPPLPLVGVFLYNLSDLTSFSATFSGTMLTSLNFTTKTVSDIGYPGFFAPEYVAVTGLGTDGAQTFNGDGVLLTSGRLVLTSENPAGSAVPEPETWAMMVMGFGLAGAALRFNKRNVRASHLAGRYPAIMLIKTVPNAYAPT